MNAISAFYFDGCRGWRGERSGKEIRDPDHPPPPPRYYPLSSNSDTNPRRGSDPTQPENSKKSDEPARLGAWRTRHSLYPPVPFLSCFLHPSSLSTSIPLTPSSYSPLARYLAFLLFHRQSCSYSPTSLWSVSNLSHPLSLSLSLSFTPTSSAPFSPFFVISPPSLTPISLHPFITTPRVPTAAPSTSNDDDDEDSGTALFLSRAPNKHEFEELAYRRNYEGKHFLEMPRSSTRVG